MKMNIIQTVLFILLVASLGTGGILSIPLKKEKTSALPENVSEWDVGTPLEIMKGQEVEVSITTSGPVTVTFQYSRYYPNKIVDTVNFKVNSTITRHVKRAEGFFISFVAATGSDAVSVTVKLVRYGFPDDAIKITLATLIAFIIASFPFKKRKVPHTSQLTKGGERNSRANVILHTVEVYSQSLFMWGTIFAFMAIVFYGTGNNAIIARDVPRERYYRVFDILLIKFLILLFLAIPALFSKDIIDRFKRGEVTERSLPLSFRTKFIASSLTLGTIIYTPLLIVFFVKMVLIRQNSILLFVSVLVPFLFASSVLIILFVLFYEIFMGATPRILVILFFLNRIVDDSTMFNLFRYKSPGYYLPWYENQKLLHFVSPSLFFSTIIAKSLLFFVVVWLLTHERVYKTVMKTIDRATKIRYRIITMSQKRLKEYQVNNK